MYRTTYFYGLFFKPERLRRIASSVAMAIFNWLMIPSVQAQTVGATVSVYVTTGDGSKLLAVQPPTNFGSGGDGSYTISVNATAPSQPWDGVGGAMTDSAAHVISALPSAQLSVLMEQLFTTSGIGLNIIRLPMGASDASASGNYSYDDVAVGETDPSLVKFSIAHDQAQIIPLLQSAQNLNPYIKLLAVPWSPPAWMKTNGSMNGVTGASQFVSEINSANFPALANYFVKFIQAYQSAGLNIYAVSPQNEPLNTNSTYPTNILTASDEANFIGSYLGPALANAEYANVKIFGLEDNWADTAYSQTLLQSSTASTYLSGTSFHWYNGSVSAMQTIRSLDPSKGVWFTEAAGTATCAGGCTLAGSTFSASGFRTHMQNLVIGVTQNSGRSIVEWNLALDQNEGPQNGGCANCVGLVTIDSSTSPASIYYNTGYYALGHIGKFVIPGANVISSTSESASGIESVAFLNPDGSEVLVVFNAGSATRTFTVSSNGQSFDYTLPKTSAATFVWSTL